MMRALRRELGRSRANSSSRGLKILGSTGIPSLTLRLRQGYGGLGAPFTLGGGPMPRRALAPTTSLGSSPLQQWQRQLPSCHTPSPAFRLLLT